MKLPRRNYLPSVLSGMVCWFMPVTFAFAQMSMPTTGVLPTNPIYQSLILGSDLASLQAEWLSPVNAVQATWINDIKNVANLSTSGSVPATFGTAMNDSRIAESAALRFAMTGSTADLNKAVGALLNLAIPANNENDFITHTEVMTNYLEAYDFIRGASLADLAQSTRDTIEARLLSQTQALTNGNNTYSNARGKIGATRAFAGVLLRDQDLLDRGLSDLDGHYDYSTTDDGWFTDSQGHYLNYTMRQLGVFLRAYEQGSGVDLYANVKPYLDMTMGLRLPSGAVPNVSNGLVYPVAIHYLSQGTDPAAAGNAVWYLENIPPGFDWGITNVQNNEYTDASFFALTDFSNVPPIPPTTSPTFLAQGQSAISVFRQDWSRESDYLAISPGIDSPEAVNAPPLVIPAFHSQNDTGEILLAAKGEYILVAPGYNRQDLTNSPPGFNPMQSNWHNVILVNGATGQFDQGRMMRPEDFVHSNRLDSTEFGNFKGVSDFSTLQMNYRETDVTRSMAFPGEDYFVVADRMRSTGFRSYGFNLIGRGTQTVVSNDPNYIQVKWELNDAQVIEHLLSTNAMTLTTDTRSTHLTWDNFETTYRMLASFSAREGLFLSILETGDAGTNSKLDITKLTSSTEYLGALVENDEAGWADTILTQHDQNLRAVGDMSSDAKYAYMRKAAGELESVMIAEGSEMFDLGDPLFQADNPLTMSLHFSPDLILGTISADGLIAGTELTFFNRGHILSAMLDGVAIDFFNGVGVASVLLSGSGALEIQLTAVPEASTLVLCLVPAVAWMSRRMLRKRNGSERDRCRA
ncbi:MAG: heparinase II/III family protein [Planctomycetota bacterium]